MQNIPIFYDLYWKDNFPNETPHLLQSCIDVMQNDVSGGRHVNPPSLDRITSSSIISGTYYVHVPENSGDLVFHSGREDYAHMTHEAAIVRIPEIFLKNQTNMHVRPVYRVKPQSGDLLLWFSDVIHGVEHNKSDEHRISISFNLGLKLK